MSILFRYSNSPRVHYFFRESVLLSRPEISASIAQQKAGAPSAVKKGKRNHAERLMELAVQASIPIDQPIFVIGDGPSDHFLFRCLENLRKRYPDMPQPNGLFVRNSALEAFETDSEDCQYFANWKDLCDAFLVGGISSVRGLVLVDVDRTVILARGLMDHVYNEVRVRSLTRLCRTFATSEKAQNEAGRIDIISRELEGSLCYYVDEGDVLCFENFEVVALTGVLKVMGLLSDSNLRQTFPPDDELLDTLKLCRDEARRGNWIAQLDQHIVGSHRHWNEGMVYDLLTAAINALEQGSPSICPMFRKIECDELLAAKKEHFGTFFNQSLLEALFGSSIINIIFVSNRPITSVYDGESFVLDVY